MPAGDLITTSQQWEWNGLLLGPGTDYEVVSHKGILDSPPFRRAAVQRPSGDGTVRGTPRYDARIVELTIDVYGSSDSDLISSSLSDLMDATVRHDDDLPLVFQLPGWSNRRLECVADERTVPVTIATVHGLAERVRLMFYAQDPVMYANTETTESSPDTVVNAGNYPTWPTITLTAGATITNTTTSQAIVTTGTGTLVIDTKTRTVTKAGVNAYDQIGAATEWFALQPGNNVLTGTASSVVYRDAWV